MPFEYKIGILLLALSLLASAAIAADEKGMYAADENEMYTVDVSSNDTLGDYLVDGDGLTLYYFKNDTPGAGNSTCYGRCLELWPAFYAEDISVPESLNESDFTDVMRTDGKEQTAYKGWPLYYFYLDKESGDIYGQGVNNVWFVINPMDFSPMNG